MSRTTVILTTVLATSVAWLSGCTRSTMTRMFAAANLDKGKQQLRFYRVTVDGHSSNSEAKLQAGFYDAGALHGLFGEAAASNEPSTPSSPASVTLTFDPVTGQMQKVDNDRRFTILWGTNADAIANQLSVFASSAAQGDSLARLMAAAAGQEEYAARLTAQIDAERAERAKDSGSETLDRLAGEVKDETESDNARRALLRAIEAMIRDAGGAVTISTGPGADLDEMRARAEGALETLKSGGAP